MAYHKTSVENQELDLFGDSTLLVNHKSVESTYALNSNSVADNTICFMSFGSGSSGNSAYIGDSECGFLIDAGVDPVKVESALKEHGVSMNKVRGILLTHDHGDHVRYIYSLIRNFRHLLVYCTPKILNGILRRHSISRRIKDYHRAVYKEFEVKIGKFVITPFEVSHDGTDNCGFFISKDNSTMSVATDLGCITERAAHYISRSNFVMIESNYDSKMLLDGTYHDHLKARIMSDTGHLENKESAKFIASILNEKLSHVFLCHLSSDNNTPELALQEFVNALKEKNQNLTFGNGLQEHLSDMQIVVLPRYEATPLYYLKPRAI